MTKALIKPRRSITIYKSDEAYINATMNLITDELLFHINIYVYMIL